MVSLVVCGGGYSSGGFDIEMQQPQPQPHFEGFGGGFGDGMQQPQPQFQGFGGGFGNRMQQPQPQFQELGGDGGMQSKSQARGLVGAGGFSGVGCGCGGGVGVGMHPHPQFNNTPVQRGFVPLTILANNTNLVRTTANSGRKWNSDGVENMENIENFYSTPPNVATIEQVKDITSLVFPGMSTMPKQPSAIAGVPTNNARVAKQARQDAACVQQATRTEKEDRTEEEATAEMARMEAALLRRSRAAESAGLSPSEASTIATMSLSRQWE